MAGGKIPRTCETCSKEFIARRYDVKRGLGRFCSRYCTGQHRTKQGTQTVTCKTCGKPFTVHSSVVKNGKGKYCSPECLAPAEFTVRFWAKVDKTPGLGPQGECWEWRGAKSEEGYGSISQRVDSKKQTLVASRVSWEIHNGPIPKGLCACHRCDNPPCVNPDHLFLGTHQDNVSDRISKGRGLSAGGPALTPDKVRLMRRQYQAGVSSKELAVVFGRHQRHIQRVINRRVWKHVV